MDHLKICVDALRLLAGQPRSPNCVPLAEQRIKEYLRAQIDCARSASLQKLSDVINKEAEQHPGQDFWITMQAYVQSLVSKLEPDEPLPPLEE